MDEKTSTTEKANEPKFDKFDKNEIYNKITELTKKGETKSKIGLELKKQKIHSTKRLTGKRISKIQDELKLIKKDQIPDDLMALIKKAVKLIKHKATNKKDMTSKRGYQLTISKINRLRNYYIKKGKLPKGWIYTDDSAKLLVK